MISSLMRLVIILIVNLALTSCVNKINYDQEPDFYSYIIGDLKSRRPLAEYHSEVAVTPASCQKIITSSLAYKVLGRNYHYHTDLYLTKNNEAILSFRGDPTLTSQDLTALLEPLKQSNFNGKIIIDNSSYKTQPLSNNIMKDDIGKNYAQPIAAINLDQNLINIKIKSAEIGKTALLTNDLGYKVISEVVTTTSTSKIILSWEENSIKATGTIADNEKLEYKISPLNLKEYFLKKIKQILKQLELSSEVIIIDDSLKITENKELVNSHSSPALYEFLPPALKKSDNFVFDNLYLTLIHQKDPIGIEDWAEGDKIIKSLIKEHFNIDMEGSLIVDGSGISHYNHVKVSSLYELLKKGYDLPDFVASLVRPKEANSTLESRSNLPAHIYAKTGSLYGTKCLCGYSVKDNKVKVFVIITTGFSSAAKLRLIQDKFVNYYLP
jgi:D-alanyl-D-alanine carboxypeptidase/D-alanyl-D-alanine-endopeptidase (penicillin-binding protein 4)